VKFSLFETKVKIYRAICLVAAMFKFRPFLRLTGSLVLGHSFELNRKFFIFRHHEDQTSALIVMWNYVVTANKPTAVSHSLVGNFTSPTDLNLVIRYSEFLKYMAEKYFYYM
jgi:hypothetical protein